MKDHLILYGLSAAMLGLIAGCSDTGSSLTRKNMDIPTLDPPVRTIPVTQIPENRNIGFNETPTPSTMSPARAQYSAESTRIAIATQERRAVLYGSPVSTSKSVENYVLRDGTAVSPTSYKVVELIRQPGRTFSTRYDRETSGIQCSPRPVGKTVITECTTEYRNVITYEIDGPDNIARVEQCRDLVSMIECTQTPFYIPDEVYRNLSVGQLIDTTGFGPYATTDSSYYSRSQDYPHRSESPQGKITERIPK